MKTLLLVALVAIMPVGASAGDLLGGAAEITPAKGWVATPARPARIPTLSYALAEGEDASMSISLFRTADIGVHDSATLLEFHRRLCGEYGDAKAVVPLTRFQTAAGEGVSITYEDPSLVGKPVQKGEYRMATVVCTYLQPEFVTYATVFTNDSSGPVYETGLAMAKSARIIPLAQRPVAPPPIVAFRDLGSELQLPAGFERVNERAHPSPHYFYFEKDGIRLSGWLEPAGMYRKHPSFQAFWTHERKAIEKGGVAISGESVKQVAGWSVATYRAALAGLPESQPNLRACRVVGDTWADVHLSAPVDAPDFADLESTLKALVLRPKSATKPLQK
jgi:hypothetical protein